jgi:hypothetical protein
MIGSGLFRSVYPLYGAQSQARNGKSSSTSGWPANTLILGTIVEGIQCVLPSAADWHYLQPSEATDLTDVWDPDAHLPWPCLVLKFSPSTPADLGEDTEDWTAQNDRVASDVVRALRLLRSGWFLDPALSECIHDDGKGHIQRRMGAYRLMYHDEDAMLSRPPVENWYDLDSVEFSKFAEAQNKPAKESRLARVKTHLKNIFSTEGRLAETPAIHHPDHLSYIFDLMRKHRSNPVGSVEIALKAFGRAQGPRLNIAQRVTLLTIVLEAIFGTVGQSEILEPVSKRVETALRLVKSPAASTVADWFDKDLRVARNAVAHGRNLKDETITSPLLDLARAALLQYVVFSIYWLEGNNPHFKANGGATTASCTFAFNAWLSGVAAGREMTSKAPWL